MSRMATDLSAFCNRIAELLTHGRLEDLAALHALPCPYETLGSMEIMTSSEVLSRAVGRWCEAQRARGVRRFEAQVVAQDLPRGPRLRAWVRWVHQLADGSVEDGGTDLLYLRRRPDGRFAIEMIEFLHLSASPDRLPDRVAAAG